MFSRVFQVITFQISREMVPSLASLIKGSVFFKGSAFIG